MVRWSGAFDADVEMASLPQAKSECLAQANMPGPVDLPLATSDMTYFSNPPDDPGAVLLRPLRLLLDEALGKLAKGDHASRNFIRLVEELQFLIFGHLL
eukprot:CAMPEP_0169288118 /NCGR_PEP_ID=MMETSP1016-20121227/60361_1 /TAXON_ID=342587 /ORGANISM="Karlodinium micrum, Strain CCMP2283" /LENGTH=98 /DNA_ID=CAMNT_0009378271 /DNA_START=413 /DNA_END=710 /DNA_ORIENTATION=+